MTRKMRMFFMFFIACFMAMQNVAMGAISVKKAAPVATKQNSVSDNSASMFATVAGLVGGIQQMTQTRKKLTAECIPSTSEISFVNKMMKEWAKTGLMTADEAETMLGISRCSEPTGGYQASISISEGGDEQVLICYDWFGGTANKDMIWEEYPMATLASYCADGSLGGCSSKNKRYVSNIYDVFNLIDFDETDYTKQEAAMAGKLISKIENCSDAKLDAKKKALWGDFLQGTIAGMGQKTNTGTIMQMVGGVANSGGTGLLQSLGGIATQFMQ